MTGVPNGPPSTLLQYSFFFQRRLSHEIGNMVAHSTIYYLFLFAVGQILPLNAADEDTFQPLCSRMCDSSRDFRHNIPFPYKCSCSQSCTVFGDCCYDSPYKGERKPSQFVCVSVHVLGDFRVVASCPGNQHSDRCRERSGHLPPVTSRNTNITYGNVYCASCNDDGDNLTIWNVQLRCSVKSDGLDYDLDSIEVTHNKGKFRERNAREENWRSCKFYANDGDLELLSDMELRSCRNPPKVSKCPPTWTDSSVKQKCRSYADPVYIGDSPFRNSHCATCNYMSLDYIQCIPSYVKQMLEDEEFRSCIVNSRHRWQQCMYAMDRPPHSSVSGMLEKIGVPSPRKGCRNGKKRDPITRKCRGTRTD